MTPKTKLVLKCAKRIETHLKAMRANPEDSHEILRRCVFIRSLIIQLAKL